MATMKTFRWTLRISLVVGVIWTLLFYFKLDYDYYLKETRVISKGKSRYVLNTKYCTIPYFDPFDPEAASLGEELSPVDCGSRPALTYLRHQLIHVNHSVLVQDAHGLRRFQHCLYTAIQSPSGTGLDLETGQPIKFRDSIEFKDEFAVVECLDEKGEVLYDDAYAQILDKTPSAERSRERLAEFRRRESPAETLSVLILLTDSTSRLSFHRLMGKTRSLLLEEMGALEFLAHMKVAEATRMNLHVFFTGRTYAENMAAAKVDDDAQGYQDNLPFIWSNLSAHGYRTLFAEDVNIAGTFQYENIGQFFRKSPFDYDYRPMGYFMENGQSRYRGFKSACQGSKMITDALFDWSTQFLEKHRHTPHFAVVFNSILSHDDYNGPGLYDNVYHQYIKLWHTRNLLNNTVLLVAGDHGLRFGRTRLRYRGRVEDHMPLLMIRFPPWFSRKYPAIQRALETNRGRLSSHYDVHATLLHLLHFRGPVPVHLAPRRGQSLLTKLPGDRSCPDAGIPHAYCICDANSPEGDTIDLKSTNHELRRFLRNAAIGIVLEINKKLELFHDLCVVYGLDGIVSARESGGKTQTTGARRYLVAVRVKPGGGVFETLDTFIPGERRPHRVTEEIFRVDKYGNQSHCLPVFQVEARTMCFCLNQ